MPISKSIPEEIAALEFAIQEFTSQAKSNNGMSEGQVMKREKLKDALQCFHSIKTRLKLIDARQNVIQPSLF